jgi:hypothetical protein
MFFSLMLLQALSTDVEDQIAVQMCRAINRERTSRGLIPLNPNQSLTQAAYAHALDMDKRRYFDHISPDGTGFTFRCAQNRYPGIAVAENIYYASFQIEAEPVVAGWMESDGHRKNILAREATEIGLGMAGKRARYLVMVVGRRSARPVDEAKVFGIEKDENGRPFVRFTSPLLKEIDPLVKSEQKINEIVLPTAKGDAILASVGGVVKDQTISTPTGIVVSYSGITLAPGIHQGQSVVEGQWIGNSTGRTTLRIQSPAYGFFDPTPSLERANLRETPAYAFEHPEFLPMSPKQIRWDGEIVAINENRRTMMVHRLGEIDSNGESRGDSSLVRRVIAFDTLDFKPQTGDVVAAVGKKPTQDQPLRASAVLILRTVKKK